MKVMLSQILSSLESGGRPKGGASTDNKGIPSLGAEHLDSNGGFNFKSVKYIPVDYFNGLKNGIIEKENILIVKDGATTGKVSFVTEEFPFEKASVNEHVFLLKIDKAKAYPKFAFHYLKCPQGQREIMRDFRGATVGGISRNFVDFVKFELPPLPDQLHIANLLSKAENLIAWRKESIRLLDEFLKSIFLGMFGEPFSNPKKWDKKTLNEICLKKGQYGSGASAVEYSPDKPRYVRITDIKDDGSLSSDLKAPSTEPEEWKDYELNVGDILFARSGATVGKTYMHADIYGNCIYAGYLIRFVPKKDVMLPTFLFHFTRTNYYKSWILDNQSVMAQPNINANQYGNNLKVIVPPIALQAQFAQIVEKTEALKTQYQQSLQELENLYGSLSQKAFRGELSICKNQKAVQI